MIFYFMKDDRFPEKVRVSAFYPKDSETTSKVFATLNTETSEFDGHAFDQNDVKKHLALTTFYDNPNIVKCRQSIADHGLVLLIAAAFREGYKAGMQTKRPDQS